MACLLTDLTITSVDLVERGANPGAEIKITKSQGEEKRMEKEETLEITRETLEEVVRKAVEEAVESLSAEPETPEAELPETEEVPEPEVVETEVEKALAEKDTVVKALEAKVTDLEKSLEEVNRLRELDELERFARRYETLGTPSAELAKTLQLMKSAGDDVYSQYLKSLDAQLALERETGIFKEYGTSQSGGSGELDAVVKSYTDDGLTVGEAWEKVAIDRPDLFEEYDRNYKNGGF